MIKFYIVLMYLTFVAIGGDAFAVGSYGDEPLASEAKTCSVSCGGNRYACCQSGGAGGPSCYCEANNVDRDCDAGGRGATTCSIGNNILAD